MKLTKTQRAKFVADVMADLPRPAMKARRAAIEEFQRACINMLPPGIMRIYKQFPKMFLHESFDLSGFYIPFGSIEFYPDHINLVRFPVVDSGKMPLEPDYSTQEPYKEECWQAKQLEKRLADVVGQCVTLADLKTALPEFEKYMPEVPEKVIRLLPVVVAGGLVADICKLGHPVCAPKSKVKNEKA